MLCTDNRMMALIVDVTSMAVHVTAAPDHPPFTVFVAQRRNILHFSLSAWSLLRICWARGVHDTSAEQSTSHWLTNYLSLQAFIYLSIYPTACLSVCCLSLCLSLYISMHTSGHPSNYIYWLIVRVKTYLQTCTALHLTLWRRVLPSKLIVVHLVMKFPTYKEL